MSALGLKGPKTLTLLGVVFFLSACAQSQPAGDPSYAALAPRAEVLARNTVQTALETAQSRSSLGWSFVEDGSSGAITPLRSYKSTTGYYCREYVEVIETAANGSNSRQRTACRDVDGVWKPIRS
ncbi:hypothetical protein HBA54_03900 [Pelagibius litoralis]|uniref:Surface antigen domain-containing protein n=1 Tax=Pelagibius litoralis TaxID=374515 RepID=A0A967C3Q5_9PROT|nr:RT0821/Lpp0805 family surface protein [Pelagibius litoralis]NIA67725.1 hypothetical protein [Pelagibius litoralis]